MGSLTNEGIGAMVISFFEEQWGRDLAGVSLEYFGKIDIEQLYRFEWYINRHGTII